VKACGNPEKYVEKIRAMSDASWKALAEREKPRVK